MVKTSKSVPQQDASLSFHPATNAEVTASEAAIPKAAAPEVAAPEVSAPEPPKKSFIPGVVQLWTTPKSRNPQPNRTVVKEHRGFPKTIELRPLEGDEDASLLIDSSVTGQFGAAAGEKKKRKRKSSGFLGSEVKPKKRVACKPKKSTNSRVLDSDSLLRIRDEFEENNIFIAHGSTPSEERATTEEKNCEVEPLPVRDSEVEMEIVTSQETAPALKEAAGVINIFETPSYTDSMLDEAQAGKEKSSEGDQGADDPLRSFFDGVDMPRYFTMRASSGTVLRSISSSSSSRSRLERRTVKDLQAELDRAQKEALTLRREHADLVKEVKVFEVRNEELVIMANDKTSQVQQKIDQIDQLRMEMNEIQAIADGWKSEMDLLATEKETAQSKLSSVEVQLRVAKEKDGKRSPLNDGLRAQLSSVVAQRDALGREYEVMKSKLETIFVDAEEMVAQYKADVEAAEARLKTNAEYIR
ncbi:uncharacterized protein [Nicotiana tomentosiformis]|uniref:uncharacterized protein n=1 Tax=Nicotiana tomentosiformis TaxID=4098 RepID=UPI00388CD62E